MGSSNLTTKTVKTSKSTTNSTTGKTDTKILILNINRLIIGATGYRHRRNGRLTGRNKVSKVRVSDKRVECVLGLASSSGETGSGMGNIGGGRDVDIRRNYRRSGRSKRVSGLQHTKPVYKVMERKFPTHKGRIVIGTIKSGRAGIWASRGTRTRLTTGTTKRALLPRTRRLAI